MNTASKILREPLLHFLLAGAALFGLYHLAGNRSDSDRMSRDRIVVTSARIDNLATVFARTWNRPPTRDELEGLVQDYIDEEVLYREALELGLDQDDTVVRRRLRQKMEFISSDLVESIAPTEEQLRTFFDEQRERFAYEPRLSFQHVFFNRDRRGDEAHADAKELLLELVDGADSREAGSLGDATMLPRELTLARASEIAGQFGDAFAKAVLEIEPGQWAGPIVSTYGVHLVRVSERVAGYVPELSEVRKYVELDWLFQRRKELQDQFNRGMRSRYEILVEWPDGQTDEMPGEASK